MFPQIRSGERAVPPESASRNPDRSVPTAPVSLTEARPTPWGAPVSPESVAGPEALHASVLHLLTSLEHALAALGKADGPDEEELRVATEALRCAKGALKLPMTQAEMPAEARAAHAAQRADPSRSPHFGG